MARALVVCPANLKNNWVVEIKNLTGRDAFVLMGMAPDMHVHFPRLLAKQEDSFTIINYDILGAKITEKEERVINDSKVTQKKDRFLWVELLNMCQFDIIFFDEVHYAKNVEANRTKATMMLDAPRKIGLTGTPVLNRPGEIWSFLHMIAPDRFPSYDGFLHQYTIDNKTARNVEDLRKTLKTLMLRRTKKEVMADLPPINRIYKHHELSTDALRRYELALAGIWETLSTWSGRDGAGFQMNITSMLAQMVRLKQICADDKIETVADLATNVSDSEDCKVLIFSQFKKVVDEVTKRLGHEAISYHGDMPMPKRIEAIKQFRSDDTLKFLVGTIQTMGTGLNLENAENVIFVDYMWTPANHMQAEERAYGRLADPHPITSYYVTADNTIENYIQDILARKLAVIESVVEGLDTERAASIANDVISALRKEMYKKKKGKK